MGHSKSMICEISYFFKQWPGSYLEFLSRAFENVHNLWACLHGACGRMIMHFFLLQSTEHYIVIKQMGSGTRFPGAISRFLI